MKAAFSERFIRQYSGLSAERKAKFDKQLGFLLTNLRHPSLRAKKYDEARDIWQARVDDDYRFYFQPSRLRSPELAQQSYMTV